MCEHKWIHTATNCFKEPDGSLDKYIRIDHYYCEKCLEKQTKRQETLRHFSSRQELPDWWIR